MAKKQASQIATGKRSDQAVTLTRKAGDRYRQFIAALLLIVLAIYGNTLSNGYALDDLRILKNSLVARGIAGIPRLAVTPYHYGFMHNRNDFYRPLSLITFAAEQQFFPQNAFLGHLVSISLFAACTVLLFILLWRLFGQGRIMLAFVASLLFAVHPIHTEVVANIKSRDELLGFIFCILSLLCFLRYYDNGRSRQLIVGGLCLFLSLFAKETAITMMAIIPIVFFFYRRGQVRRAVAAMMMTTAVCVGYLVLRFSVLKAYDAGHSGEIPLVDNALLAMPPGTSKMATAIMLLGKYLLMLVWPHPLICDYSLQAVPYAGFGSISFMASLAVHIFLVVFAVYRLFKKPGDILAFSILFYVVTLFLFSNVAFTIGTAFAERFLFYPSVGFCIAMAWLAGLFVGAAKENVQMRWMPIAAVAIVFAILTIYRNTEWSDNYTLYTADLRKAPDNARLHWYVGNELGSGVAANARTEEERNTGMRSAIAELQAAVSILPDFPQAHADLGHAFFLVHQLDSAEAHSRRALISDPGNGGAFIDLVDIRSAQGRYMEAIAYDRQAKIRMPNNMDIDRNMAFAFWHMKMYDSSEKYFKAVLEKYPEDAAVNNYLAGLFHEVGKDDSAQIYLDRYERYK